MYLEAALANIDTQWTFSSNHEEIDHYRIFWGGDSAENYISALREWGKIFDGFLCSRNDYLLFDYLKEIETYDAIENEYIKVKYPGYKIERWLSIFGGRYRGVPHEKVLIYLNDYGEVYINNAAPANIKAAFNRIGITC